MSDIFDEIEEDAIEGVAIASDNELKSLSGLLEQQIELEEEIAQLETAVSEAKKRHQFLTTKTIPDHATAINCTLHRLESGHVFELKPFVSANIPKAKKEEAFTWLKEQGYDDIIKNVVSIEFGKGDDEKAAACLSVLDSSGFSAHADSSVHAATLKKWVRERVEEGIPVPLELFGAYLGQKSTISKGK